MRTMHKIKRRHLWAPAALLAAGPLALSACGKGSGSNASDGPAEGTSSYDLDDVYDINEQPRENLQEGGQLTLPVGGMGDRKSTRLNSSHVAISYAVFCLKKKKPLSSSVA